MTPITTPSGVAEQADAKVTDWIRNNYQDHTTVDSLCDALDRFRATLAASQAASHSAPEPVVRNQCDGCAVGAYVNRWGNHCMPDGGLMACTAHRYAAPLGAESKACASGGVSPAQEPKYTVNGHAIVNRASGEEIPADEPVFIFRARDALGVRALYAYLEMIGEREPESLHSEAVRARIAHFQEFARKFPERMKWPDTAIAASPAPSVGEPVARDVLQDLIDIAIQSCDHTPQSFNNAVQRIALKAHKVLATPPAAPAVTEGASLSEDQRDEVLDVLRNTYGIEGDLEQIVDTVACVLAGRPLFAPAAAVPESPAAEETDEGREEAAEIIGSLIEGIEKHGMYSMESTLGSLTQAYYSLRPANALTAIKEKS